MRKPELFIDGVSVPLADEFGINFTKTIADINKPEARQSSFSQTVTIPGTKEVNTLFNFWFDINVDSTFNAQKKVDAIYYEDSIEQLTGYFRLVSVSIEDDEVIYTGSIHGDLSSIFKDMGDSLLSDLDFSDLDHTYNAANVLAGFTPTLGTAYYYPMLDYSSKANYDLWVTGDFRPAVFFKEFVDRIFDLYGFTYSSVFFDSTTFKSLVMPSISGDVNLTAQQILDRSFYVGRTAATVELAQTLSLSTLPHLPYDDDTTAPWYNTLNSDYDITGSGDFTCQNSGTYTMSFDIDGFIKWDGGNQTIAALPATWIYEIIRTRAGASDVVLGAIQETANMPNLNMVNGDATPSTNTIVTTVVVNLEQGDVVFMRVRTIRVTSDPTLNPALWLFGFEPTSEWKVDFTSNALTVGTPVLIGNTIPEMKQKDFMLGIIKAFNLYIEDLGDKELLIEPRDGGYYTDDIVDWTNKLNSKTTFFPNERLQGKQYDYKFKEEADTLHDNYFRDVRFPYGDFTLNIDDDFKTETKTIELPFASTLLANPDSATSANPNNRPIATMYFTDDAGVITEGDTQPRMLYAVPSLSSPIVAGSPGWTFNGGGALATYPYAGDFSLPYGLNTIMLDFKTPSQVYYDGDIPIVDTNKVGFGGDTLYSFYEQMMADILNPVMEAQFYLDALDVFNISFRKRYFIGTVYYRLLSISKDGELYKGKFLKIE